MFCMFLLILSFLVSPFVSYSMVENINIDQNPVLVGETIYKIPKINNFYDIGEAKKVSWLENPQVFDELKENIKKNLPQNVPFFPEINDNLKQSLNFIYTRFYKMLSVGIYAYGPHFFVSYGEQTLEPAVKIIENMVVKGPLKEFKLLFVNSAIRENSQVTNVATYLLQNTNTTMYTVPSFGKKRKKEESWQREFFFDEEKDTNLVSDMSKKNDWRYAFQDQTSLYQNQISMFISVGNDIPENDYKKIVDSFKRFTISLYVGSKRNIVILYFTNDIACDYVCVTDPDNLEETYEIDRPQGTIKKYVELKESPSDVVFNQSYFDDFLAILLKSENFENFARNFIKIIKAKPNIEQENLEENPSGAVVPEINNNPPPEKEEKIPFYKTWKFIIGISGLSIFSIITYLIKKGKINNPFSR